LPFVDLPTRGAKDLPTIAHSDRLVSPFDAALHGVVTGSFSDVQQALLLDKNDGCVKSFAYSVLIA